MPQAANPTNGTRNRKGWYMTGFNDGADSLPCDPPYEKGNRHYDEYVSGFEDGQRAEGRGQSAKQEA